MVSIAGVSVPFVISTGGSFGSSVCRRSFNMASGFGGVCCSKPFKWDEFRYA